MSTQLTATSTTAAPSRVQRRVPPLLSFHAVLAAFIVVLVFVVMRQNTADPDLWWHLKNAQYVVQNHTFPFHDVYSFTARGQAWVPHEWLGEMLLYAGFKVAGLQGVWGVSFVWCSLIFTGVLLLCYRASGDIKNSMLVTIIGVMLGKISFGPRTLLLGWLCLVVLLLLLEPLRRGEPVKYWAFPLLFLFWVNAHGSWFMGMIIFVIVIACGLFQHSWAQVDALPYARPYAKKVIGTVAASAIALLINPAGIAVVLYPLDVRYKQTVSVAQIQEWASVDFHQGNGVLLIAVILLLLAVALFSEARWTIEEFALASLALYMSVTYVRMLFLAGILIPPILAKRIRLFSEYDPEAENRYLNTFALVVCLLGIIAFCPTKAQLNAQVEKMFPIDAVAYLKSQPESGNLFHEYLWGGYLIENDVPVFIDGRGDIYDHNGTFRDYVAAQNMDAPFAVLEKYKIQRALLMPGTPLSSLLSRSPAWQIERKDNVSILFHRKDGATQ